MIITDGNNVVLVTKAIVAAAASAAPPSGRSVFNRKMTNNTAKGRVNRCKSLLSRTILLFRYLNMYSYFAAAIMVSVALTGTYFFFPRGLYEM